MKPDAFACCDGSRKHRRDCEYATIMTMGAAELLSLLRNRLRHDVRAMVRDELRRVLTDLLAKDDARLTVVKVLKSLDAEEKRVARVMGTRR